MSGEKGTLFNVGDVVMLKSGGPQMTIASYGKYGMIEEEGYLCVWFEKNAKKEAVKKEAVFAEPLLKRASSSVGVVSIGRG
ncbi:YodC family protein [Bilophila wadsworthia]|uniref:YodC family protein n=1 Tax=Bilophila wadsworthia TaxID=35833 RepID=UPI00242F5AC1|nr:DUF2158 domain-containing protein [Bilophila wadsworthia]